MELPSHIAEAAKAGNLEAVKTWLAQPSADIEAEDERGWHLLHHSCMNCPVLTADHVALVEYLLSCGTDINHREWDGCSPLHLAVARHFRPESADMVGLLLHRGIEVNVGDHLYGKTPLAWAVERFYRHSDPWSVGTNIRALDCVVKLLRYGASLDAIGALETSDMTSKPIEAFFVKQVGYYPSVSSDEHFVACRAIVAGVRAAGGWRAFRDAPTNPWRAYERVPRKAVLRLRSLVARGRATVEPPFKALFASPNEIVWHVLSFWDARVE